MAPVMFFKYFGRKGKKEKEKNRKKPKTKSVIFKNKNIKKRASKLRDQRDQLFECVPASVSVVYYFFTGSLCGLSVVSPMHARTLFYFGFV
jgi:hypothetical protein